MGKNDFCCAPSCSHERSKGATCTFHRIPTKPQWVRKAWLTKISRVVKRVVKGKTVTKPWKPSSSARICSCHFEKAPPTTCGRPKKSEREACIPTIFSHRKPSSRPTRTRRRLSKSIQQREQIEITKVISHSNI